MKTPTRRLGRGLGAFLDFGPVDEDGATRVSDAISCAEAPSVLETSATAPAAPPPAAASQRPAEPPVPAQSPRPVLAAAPASAPRVPAIPPAAAVDDDAFIDDVVSSLTFPDVELE